MVFGTEWRFVCLGTDFVQLRVYSDSAHSGPSDSWKCRVFTHEGHHSRARGGLITDYSLYYSDMEINRELNKVQKFLDTPNNSISWDSFKSSRFDSITCRSFIVHLDF